MRAERTTEQQHCDQAQAFHLNSPSSRRPFQPSVAPDGCAGSDAIGYKLEIWSVSDPLGEAESIREETILPADETISACRAKSLKPSLPSVRANETADRSTNSATRGIKWL
jgi:hypothetical protein